jgi:hypothetical protein
MFKQGFTEWTDKVFYEQLTDAERAVPPILSGQPAYKKEQGMHMLHACCLYGRIFPLEEEKGAHLPMREILVAVIREWVVLGGNNKMGG